MKKILFTIIFCIGSTLFGQVGIGTSQPHSSAILDLTATDKGFLPPRLTISQRDSINVLPAGLTIYNLDLNCMQYWNTAKWVGKCGTSPIGAPNPDLSNTCTGSYINLNANQTLNIKGKNVNVTTVKTGYTDTASFTHCGVTGTIYMGLTSVKYNFDKEVSNFKVFSAADNIGEITTYILKRNGVVVIPIVQLNTSFGCHDRYTITQNTTETQVTSNMSDNTGAIYNLGGVWFDEIEIQTNQNSGSSFNFCVGDAL